MSLKGWESVVTSEKGRGTENHLILCDEVAFCRGFKEYWDTVLEPTLLTTKGRAVFASTPNGFNDFYDLANHAQRHEDYFYLHATSYDNPFNDKELLDKKKAEMLEDRFAQEYLADFRKQEGLVYKEFMRAIHLYDDNTPISREVYLGGVDFGYTNPAAVASAVKDKRGAYWIKEEYYEKGKTDAQIAEVVSALNFEKVYPDPENPAAIQELKNKRVNVCEVLKGKGSVENGINKIRELLKQGRLKIHRDSVNLIWEFETYHYPKKVDTGNEKELPVKEDDHLLDSCRYIISMDSSTKEIRDYRTWVNKIAVSNKQPDNIAR